MSLTPSQVADRLGCRPRDITMLFYDRLADTNRAPIKGRSRRIPLEYVPELERLLRERGRLPQEQTA